MPKFYEKDQLKTFQNGIELKITSHEYTIILNRLRRIEMYSDELEQENSELINELFEKEKIIERATNYLFDNYKLKSEDYRDIFNILQGDE